MTKYALIFTGGSMKTTQDEIQQMMADWGSWYGSLGSDIVDPGFAFMPNMTASTVTMHGTESGSKSGASGYVIVQGETKEKALEYASSCPVVKDGGSVEVHEYMPTS